MHGVHFFPGVFAVFKYAYISVRGRNRIRVSAKQRPRPPETDTREIGYDFPSRGFIAIIIPRFPVAASGTVGPGVRAEGCRSARQQCTPPAAVHTAGRTGPAGGYCPPRFRPTCAAVMRLPTYGAVHGTSIKYKF